MSFPQCSMALFLQSLLLVLLLTPLVERAARHFGCMDRPEARKVHGHPTPRWGGLAVALSFFASIPVLFFAAHRLNIPFDARLSGNLAALATGALLIVIVGMVDDRFTLSAWIKLGCQVAIALILIESGIAITFVTLPYYGLLYLPGWLSLGLTMFWIVGITNALNLLDGLDGLLSGVCAIFAGIFFVVSLCTGQFVVALLMVSLCGACIGFLRYNFNPARIFLGDTGSLFLGLTFSVLSIIGAFKVTTTVSFLVPLAIMFLPIFDTSFAIVRRLRSGHPLFKPDKGHVHHRLLARGFSVRQVVVLLYAVCGVTGMLGIAMLIMGR